MFKITYTINFYCRDPDNYPDIKVGEIESVLGNNLDEAKSNLVNQLKGQRFGLNHDRSYFDLIADGKVDSQGDTYGLEIISVDEIVQSDIELGEITEIEEAVKAKKAEIEAEKKKKREQAKRKKLTKEQKELKELQRLQKKYQKKV